MLWPHHSRVEGTTHKGRRGLLRESDSLCLFLFELKFPFHIQDSVFYQDILQMQSPFSVVSAQISIGNPCSLNTVSRMVLIQVFNCASHIFAPSGLGITQGNTSRILSLFLFQPVQCGETFALSHTMQLSPCRCSPCHAQELGAASPCESFSVSVPQQQCLFLRGAHLPAESKCMHLNQVSPVSRMFQA